MQMRIGGFPALWMLLLGLAGLPGDLWAGGPEAFLGYDSRETDRLNDSLGYQCHVTLEDPRFGEIENVTVTRVDTFYKPSQMNGHSMADAQTHLTGYRLRRAPKGVASPVGSCNKNSPNKGADCTHDADCGGGKCVKTSFRKGSFHASRTEKNGNPVVLVNDFGSLTLGTTRRKHHLVPTAMGMDGAPTSLTENGLDHYLCYGVERVLDPVDVPGVESQQNENGWLKDGLQVLVENEFADGAGHYALGDAQLYNLTAVSQICNPVFRTNIDTDEVATLVHSKRTTTCELAEATEIHSAASLVCYEAVPATAAMGVCSGDPDRSCGHSRDCGSGQSCDFMPYPHLSEYAFPEHKASKRLRPQQSKVPDRWDRDGSALFVKNDFGHPGYVNTHHALEFCVPTHCGNGHVDQNEECDDGNFADGDGCNNDCQLSCGDGVLQTEIGEMCDPPGTNSCLDGSVCSDQCLCEIDLGVDESDLYTEKVCQRGPNHGELCVKATDCPSGRCVTASNFNVTVQLGGILLPPLAFPLVGGTTIDCETVDPTTGLAECGCNLTEIEPVLIGGIGKVCFDPGDASECPTGLMDCDGGTPMDQDLILNHDIASCAGPDHDSCASKCEIYCGMQGPGYVRHDSQCEGLCVDGPHHGEICQYDVDCPGGSCAGGDPVEHGEKCNCSCIQQGGAPSRPGSLSCHFSVAIDVFPEDPNINCGEGLPDIDLGNTCIPMTSEHATAELRNFNFNAWNPGSVLTVPSPPDTGVPGQCPSTASGFMGYSRLVGNIGFYDTKLGDMLVPLTVDVE